MLGHDGEQRNGFLNATRLGRRVIEKGASLDHIVARVRQKNGPWVCRLGGQENSLPTKCLDVVRRRALVDAKRDRGVISRGKGWGSSRNGSGQAANRRGSMLPARRWWNPVLGTTIAFLLVPMHNSSPGPARRSRRYSATTESSAWFILPVQGHEAISWLVRSSGQGLRTLPTTHDTYITHRAIHDLD